MPERVEEMVMRRRERGRGRKRDKKPWGEVKWKEI